MTSPWNFEADAITQLPDDLINKILAYLPLHVAVRTSSLSREWKYKWLSIPNIIFDLHFTDSSTLKRKNQLERVIYKVLLRHRGPIDKFVFKAHCYERPDVYRRILLLSGQKLQDFTLEFLFDFLNMYILPSRFFAFQYLRHLKLKGCVFEPPPTFKGFSKLLTLDFETVMFAPRILMEFISQCVLLERVRLNLCTDFDSVEFDSPSLKFLTYHGAFNSIRFKNCPRLAEVTLSTYTLVDSFKPYKYFDFLPTMEKVHINLTLLQSFGVGKSVPKRFPQSLESLKFLFLSMNMDTIEEVSFALCLIRSSPNLQVLDILLNLHSCEVKEYVVKFICAQEKPDVFLDQLKRVRLECVSSFAPPLEFIKCLLACAPALEEMVISPCSISHVGNINSLTNDLKQMRQASPHAVIHVKRACGDCMCDRMRKLL